MLQKDNEDICQAISSGSVNQRWNTYSVWKSKSTMAVSMRDLDSAFQGAGQKVGLDMWRIENFQPVPVAKSSHGKFFSGDSYIILKTTAIKSGAFHHDLHYWLGKDTNQDEAGAAAMKTIELNAALGGRAVQHREIQGYETDKFLSYFKPCIIPQEGGVASGFKHADSKEHQIRLFACKGNHVAHVKEVPYSRSSLNHDDVFILDTESKVFQFNSSNSSIQERAKALGVVQYIKDNYHAGKCEVAIIEDGKFVADPETGEFWSFFGGFAPLSKRVNSENDSQSEAIPGKFLGIQRRHANSIKCDVLKREMLDTNKCYLLDCGIEIFVWIGRQTSLDDRKEANSAAEELITNQGRVNKTHLTHVVEGFETVRFRSNFDMWSQERDVISTEEGRGKLAALLKSQGFNVKGILKAAPGKEDHQPYLDCTGNLQVWRVNDNIKTPVPSHDQCKLYGGDCFVVQYTFPGEEKEEYMLFTWLGKNSIKEDRDAAILLMRKMMGSLKGQAIQAQVFEGKEPIQFFSIFQRLIVFKGGLSSGYKRSISDKGIADDTYQEDAVSLFRVQGTGLDNMQAIQVEPVATSLNSSYCYILQTGTSIFTWSGSLSEVGNQEILERMLDLIKPNIQPKAMKEGNELDAFWDALGGKKEYPSQKEFKDLSRDPHLFVCDFNPLKDNLETTEIFNFGQDDLMTEDVMILDSHFEIFVWVGQHADSTSKEKALNIGQKFLEQDVLLERPSLETPIYVIMEGSEPHFFTRFFTWVSSKSPMHGNSFQRKLVILKGEIPPTVEVKKPKKHSPAAYGGRAGIPDKAQRPRSVSFSPDRRHAREKSPAFSALASTFERQNARNLSTPPPIGRNLYPKSVASDNNLSNATAPRSSSIASLAFVFEPVKQQIQSTGVTEAISETQQLKPEANTASASSTVQVKTVEDDVMEDEVEDEKNLTSFPYERLKVSSPDPVPDIDVTRRESYLSAKEFQEKFGMTKVAFSKIPRWKQNKLKMAVNLF